MTETKSNLTLEELQKASQIIAISDLVPSPYQTRFENSLSQQSLKTLASSIQELGLMTTIKVRPHPIQEGKYELICGHRRTQAAKVLGWHEIRCEIFLGLDELQVYKMVGEDNMESQPMDPIEKGRYFNLGLQKFGLSVEQLEGMFHRNIALIQSTLDLAEAIGKCLSVLIKADHEKFRNNVTNHNLPLLLSMKNNVDFAEACRKVSNGTSLVELEEFVKASNLAYYRIRLTERPDQTNANVKEESARQHQEWHTKRTKNQDVCCPYCGAKFKIGVEPNQEISEIGLVVS